MEQNDRPNTINISSLSAIPIGPPNRLYAQMMLDNLSGKNSEMSSLSLYLYNAALACQHKEISEIFQQISIQEMYHAQIFGQLALQMGESPRLWTSDQRGKKIYWSPAYNHYFREIHKLLAEAIRSETRSIDKYSQQLKQIKDDGIYIILQQIIMDEQNHMEILSRLYQKYSV